MASTEGNRSEKRASVALPEIPDKLYFRIGEVARLLDLPTYVLRFWETEFPPLKPGKGGTGQRLYRRRDVELALRIRSLLYDEGYTIPGARQLLKSAMRGKEAPDVDVTVGSAPEPVAEGVPASIRLRRMRAELREISSLLSRPVAAVNVPPVKAAHKGLHVAGSRRRPVGAQTKPLFPEDGT